MYWPMLAICTDIHQASAGRPYDTSKYLKPASALCSIHSKTMFQSFLTTLRNTLHWNPMSDCILYSVELQNACEQSHLVNSTYEPTASIAGLSISFYSVSPLAEYRGKSRHTLFLSTSTKGQIRPDKKHVQIMWTIGFYPFDDPWWHTLGILPRHGQANDAVTDIGI